MAPSIATRVMVLLAAVVYASGAAVVNDNKAVKLSTDDSSSTVKKMLQDSNSIKQETTNVSSTVTHLPNDVLEEDKLDDKLLTNNVSGDNKRRTAQGRKPAKKGKKSNSDLLRDLGLTKIRTPNANHHRKRLASQSRKTHAQKQAGDSQMFVIKLPPHPYYYGHVHPNPNFGPAPGPSEKSLAKTVNTLPVDFKFNGKPARVYHWNLPVMKKMVARKTGGSSKMSVIAGDSDMFDVKKQSTWDENDEDDPTLYRKTSYYRPRRPTKHTFYKYFTGNGRPQSFYVIEKSKKPVTYHRLLP